MRPIDADNITLKGIPMDMGGLVFIEDVLLRIEELPTVDAVPVVRCVDCKKWGTGKGSVNRCPMGMDDWPKADDYCSYGERITDDRT